MEIEYLVQNRGAKYHVFVDLPDNLRKVLGDGEKKQSDPDEEVKLVLKRLVLDAFKEGPHKHKGKNKLREINIHVHSIDFTKNEIDYTIDSESNRVVHHLAINNFDRKKAIREIEKKHVVSLGASSNLTNMQPILGRFAATPPSKGGSILDRIKNSLSNFFNKFINIFNFLDNLRGGIDPASAKNLAWDYTVLSEVCGTPNLEQMTQDQALSYLDKMLDREDPGLTSNPELRPRLKDACKLSKAILEVREHYSERKCTHLVKDIQRSIKNLTNEKLLIPVGYVEGNRRVEMLLEIQKAPTGTYTVTLISTDKETRSLFDREVGLDTESQSIRREISNVSELELLTNLQTLMELQTIPHCQQADGSAWRNIFLQALVFDKSTVSPGKAAQVLKKDDTIGHLGETIAYLRGEFADSDASTRFDLSVRLRLFLDICKSNKEGLKDKEYWVLVRTTALQLARLIEENKDVISASSDLQGAELAQIYGEIKGVLDSLDQTLPEIIDLKKQILPLFYGQVKVRPGLKTPLLLPIPPEPANYPNIDPPLPSFDAQNPVESGKLCAERCRKLIQLDHTELAAREGKLMVRMIPPDAPFWNTLNQADAAALSGYLGTIGEAIFRGCCEKGNRTSEDIAALYALNFMAYKTTTISTGGAGPLDPLMAPALNAYNQLFAARLSSNDRIWLNKIYNHLGKQPWNGATMENFARMQVSGQNLASLVDLNQFLHIALSSKYQEISAASLPKQPLHFTKQGPKVYLEQRFIHDVTTPFEDSLASKAPGYAENIANEIASRYATEYCCLGCISDNCPNYNMTSRQDQRFLPLYLIHNFTDAYCSNSAGKNALRRDELVDLFYTQQTNQSAYDLFKNKHNEQDGFHYAHGFDENDHRINVMNTFMVYLNHPNFFDHPELRWHFETKILGSDAFQTLFKPGVWDQYKPFVVSMAKSLQHEIAVSYAAGDRDKACYLSYIADFLKERIQFTGFLDQNEKDFLTQFFGSDYHQYVKKISWELIRKNDEKSIEQQKVVLPLLLNSYYKRFCLDSKDPCFADEGEIEHIAVVIARLESMNDAKDTIDPEVKDRYLNLMAWIAPRIQKGIAKEKTKGQFVNKILFYANPTITALQLPWDTSNFPCATAQDRKGNKYVFDIFTGKLSMGDLSKEEIPDKIKNNPLVRNIFGEKLEENWVALSTPKEVDAHKVVAYEHEKFPNHRIVYRQDVEPSSRITVEKNIKNKQGKDEWVTLQRFVTQDIIAEGAELTGEPDLPFTVAAAIGDRCCWVDRKKEHIYVFDGNNKDLFAMISLKTDKKNVTTIQDVHFVQDGNRLLHADPKLLEEFSAIEDPECIQVTGENNRAHFVHYPRYEIALNGAPLTYDLDKKGAVSKAFPGFRLQPFGVRPGKKEAAYGVTPIPVTFDGFQLLKKDGEEKVLIPMREYQQQVSATGQPLQLSTLVSDPTNYAKKMLFDFKVDPETNRLVAKSGDAYAYLAYLCFAHGDYRSAAYYMDKAATSTGYNKNYDRIFAWAKELKDNSPNGIAMKLRFELFQEKVIDDRRIRLIRDGKLGDMEDDKLHSVERLTRIADLYGKYAESLNGRVVGKTGSDPALDLSPEDELYTSSLLKRLLDEHGKKIIDADAIHTIPAAAVPAQQYSKGKDDKVFGLSDAALMIWMYKGNDRDRSPIGIKDPRWILQNFREVFNQILTLDTDSVEFKQLEHQIHMLSELKETSLGGGSKLIQEEKSAIKEAQFYLLKLVGARKQTRDPTDINKIAEKLGPKGVMPSLEGPLFKFSRTIGINKIRLMEAYGWDQALMESPEAVHNKCNEWKLLHENNKEAGKGRKKNDRDIELQALAHLADEIKKIVEDFRPSMRSSGNMQSGQVESASPENEFKEYFQKKLQNEIFGASGYKSIAKFDEVLKLVALAQIPIPNQSMQAAIPKPQPSETYNDKYGKLLPGQPFSGDDNRIKALEAEIIGKTLPPTPPKITTLPKDMKTVLPRDKVKQYQDYFSVDNVPVPVIKEALFDRLAASPEKAVVRHAKEARAELREALKAQKNVTITKSKAETLKDDLDKQVEDTATEREKLKLDLLQFVERFDTPVGILAMRRMVGKDAKPSLDLLINLWRRGEITVPWDQNPLKKLGMKNISQAGLEQLDKNIAAYMELTAKHKHLLSLQDSTAGYIQSCKAGANAGGDKQLAEVLYDSLSTKRCFTLDAATSPDYRDFLFLEYTQEIILREPQVETLRDMLSDPNAVRQLRMGGGKSKVLLPMLAKRKANGRNLVMLMLPEELYETNCKDLDQTNRMLFGQKMHRFDFNRKTDRSEEALKAIYTRMLSTIKSEGYMMTTKRSMLSFRDAYFELMHKLSETPQGDVEKQAELIGQIRMMNKIAKLFLDRSDIISDEVDACLDIRKEMNFSLGKGSPVDKVKGDGGIELMQIIWSAKEGNPLYRLKQCVLKNTQASILPAERQELLKMAVGNYYENHKAELSKVTSKQFIDYVFNEKGSEKTEEWVESLKVSDNALYRKLTTVKAFMENGYGYALGRVGNVNYGRDPVSEKWTIPYKASNNPNVGSEFDDDIEQISFTILDYLQNGVSYKQVHQIMARMRNNAIEEMRGAPPDKALNIDDTNAAAAFMAFIKQIDPKGQFPENISLADVTSTKQITALMGIINGTPEGRIAFCHQEVVGKIMQFSSQISSTSNDLPDMVNNFGGFTGTPWNLHTYHDKINALKSLGVDGTTWALMLGRDVKVHTFTYDAQRPVDSVLTGLQIPGNYQALIDTGTYLRGVDNHEVVDKTLETAKAAGKPVQGGIYFDKAGQIVKKMNPDEAALPIEAAPATPLMETFTIYDQAHTVGADIKQGRTAKAIVTVGENTFIRDLFQAVWRMRQLHQEQRVELAVSDEVKARILQGAKRDITVEDILEFCLVNELRREAEDNLMSEKDKIKGVPKRLAYAQIVKAIDGGADDNQIIQMAKVCASEENGLFIKTRAKEEAYDGYAALKKDEDPEAVLKALKKDAAKRCRAAGNDINKIIPGAAKQFNAKAEEVEKRAAKPADWYPNKTKSAQEVAGGEMELEAQAEVEQELELTVEAETEQQTQVVVEVNVPIKQTGAAGSGGVTPLKYYTIDHVTEHGTKTDGVRALADGIEFFDSNIFCSDVFERNLTDRRISPQTVFYSNRKHVMQVLISKDKGKWTMIIPTIHEGHAACRDFVDHNKNHPELKAAVVGITSGRPIINYKTGVDRSDALPFESNEDRDGFYKLYVQAKLFNGECEYTTEEEKKALRAWLIEKGPDKFKKYFEQNILACKPNAIQDAYPKSSLCKMFEELCVPVK